MRRLIHARVLTTALASAAVAAVLLTGAPVQVRSQPVSEVRTNDEYLTSQWYLQAPQGLDLRSPIDALDAWDPEWSFVASTGDTAYLHDYDGDRTPKQTDGSPGTNYVGPRLVRYGAAEGPWSYTLLAGQFSCVAATFGPSAPTGRNRCEVSANWVGAAQLGESISVPPGGWVRFGWGASWLYRQFPDGGDVLCGSSTFDRDLALATTQDPICQLQRRHDGGGVVANEGEKFTLPAPASVRFGVDLDWTYRILSGDVACTPDTFLAPPRPDHRERHCEVVKTRGAGVRIGIVDSGRVPHSDLNANLDAVGGLNGLKLDGSDHDDFVPAQCAASRDHGIAMAGVAAAVTNNGTGIAGVAPQASVVFVKAIPCSLTGTPETSYPVELRAPVMANSIRRVVGDLHARVVNISMNFPGPCPSEVQEAINDADTAGAIVVASASNAGQDLITQPNWPAVCNGVVAVAGTDKVGGRLPFSNYGTPIALAAPGQDIFMLAIDRDEDFGSDFPTYRTSSGTSPAAAMVSGVAALMLAKNPELNDVNVERRLALSTRAFPSGSTCADVCGSGMLDAERAMRSAEAIIREQENNDTREGANYVSASADITGNLTAKPAVAVGTGQNCQRNHTCHVLDPTAKRPDDDWFELYLEPGQTLESRLEAPTCPTSVCSLTIERGPYTEDTSVSTRYPENFNSTITNQTQVTERIRVDLSTQSMVDQPDPPDDVPYTLYLAIK